MDRSLEYTMATCEKLSETRRNEIRALRLDKEAADKNEGVAAESDQLLVARKKANHG
jgi:hypothetical protein